MERPLLGPASYGPYTQVVLIRNFNNIESIPSGTCKMWPSKQVVFISKWSLEKARLYTEGCLHTGHVSLSPH